MRIIVAADGSALGNPGPAGWAWYINQNCWATGGWPNSTNNRGELMAVLDFLQRTRELSDIEFHFLCDSQYVINSVTKWMPNWKRRGWRKADGKPVLNEDLMRSLDQELAGRPITFEWVRGHRGHDLNEIVDDLARAAATAYQQGKTPNPGPGLSPEIQGLSLSQASPSPDPATSNTATSNPATSNTPTSNTPTSTPDRASQPTLF